MKIVIIITIFILYIFFLLAEDLSKNKANFCFKRVGSARTAMRNILVISTSTATLLGTGLALKAERRAQILEDIEKIKKNKEEIEAEEKIQARTRLQKKNDEQASSITIMKCKAVARLDETEKLLKKYEKIELLESL